jgi:hypothetical protein
MDGEEDRGATQVNILWAGAKPDVCSLQNSDHFLGLKLEAEHMVHFSTNSKFMGQCDSQDD